MSATFRIHGLDELRDELRRLPAELTADASAIVQRKAGDAAQHIRAGYQAHRHTGNLAEHVKVESRAAGQFGTAMVVKSTAKHAFIFENGTQARHYVTHNGVTHVTGAMPGFHIFIPTLIRARRAMYDELAALLERHGLRVSGDAAA